MSTVTIGFFPREQFSLAAESLQRIFEYTRIPFNLIVVDCNTPKVYWLQIEQVLKGRSNVKVIHNDHYLQANQLRNLVIQEAKDEFLCFIENDVLVEEGWLSNLIACLQRTTLLM
jgi:GT2 family glycosyltransferase